MSVIEQLLIVQEHDCKIREIKKEKAEIPEKKKEEEARLNKHKKALVEAEERLKAAQAEIKKLEIESNVRREKTTKLRQQQLEIKTNKEFKALDNEIAGIENEISKIENQWLLLLEEVDKAKSDVEEKKRALSEEEVIVQGDLQKFDKRVLEIEDELKELEIASESVAKEVDPEWLKQYKRIFERKDKAVVPVESGVCGGCHMKLPVYVIHDVKKHTAMVICDFCGRLLY